MVTFGGYTSRWPRTLTVLGVGATFNLVPYVFPIGDVPDVVIRASTAAQTLDPHVLTFMIFVAFLFFYVMGEIFIISGGILRSAVFEREGFIKTFAIVANQQSPLLLDEYEKVRSIEDLCDGLLVAILWSVFMQFTQWRDNAAIDCIMYFVLILFSFSLPLLAVNALRAFDKKLFEFLKTQTKPDGQK